MKKQLLLSTLLGAVAAFSIAQGAFAGCDSCTQDVCGSLCGCKCVQCKSGCTTNTTIDCFNNGALAQALTPCFTVCSNMPCSNVELKATVDATTTGLNALSQVGGTNYIALANTSTKPTDAAVNDAIGIAAPTPVNNANVIAYPLTNPIVTDMEGNLGLSFTWSGADNAFKSSAPGVGKSEVCTTIGPASRQHTFSAQDSQGNYVAHVTMSFI